MFQLLKFLFHPPLLKKRLPLLAARYSSDSVRYPIPAGREVDIKLLIGHGLAKRPEDAARLLAEHPDWKVERIIRECKHERKRQGRLDLAWERLRRLW